MTDEMKIIFNDIRQEKMEEYRLDALRDEACERDDECYDEEDYDEDSEDEYDYDADDCSDEL